MKEGERLLINTGCMAIRLDAIWADGLLFSMDDHLFLNAAGEYFAYTNSEDWKMSEWLADQGFQYGVTILPLTHHGSAGWSIE